MRGWVVLAIAALFTGCGTGVTEPDAEQDLLGDWEWLDSTGGIAGTTRTPRSEGFDLTLRFTRSEVELLRDGVSEVRSDYTFFVGPEGSFEAVSYDEPVFGFDWSLVGFLSRDTLVLTDPCCDGFVRRWVR